MQRGDDFPLNGGYREASPSSTSSAPAAVVPSHLRAGSVVEVFYRFTDDEGGYFPVAVLALGTTRPRIGRTDGWMPAVLAEDWPAVANGAGSSAFGATAEAAAARVRVRYTHPYWCNRRGHQLDEKDDKDMVVSVACRDVRVPPPPTWRESLSLVVVRWGDYHGPDAFKEAEWGPASATVTDKHVSALCDGALYTRIGPDYEVLSIFVECAADLARVQPAALAASLRGRHVAAAYFLWPTAFQDGQHDQGGMVGREAFFACMQGFETAGVPTRFPHPSQLYRTLLSKDWQPALCLAPQFCVPPTTIVNRAHVARDPRSAARGALDALAAVRATRDATKKERKKKREAAGADGGESPLPGLESAIPRGVVKLGFAWEAAHVVMWRGETQLATALERLSTQAGCEEVVLLVQDFVPNSLEARAYVVNGQIVHTVFTTFGETDADGYQVDFARKEREAALGAWLDGDEAAMAHLERRMRKLTRRWLAWLRCRSSEAVPAIRIDFLVKRRAPGKVDVHTLELTEAGFSMLGWRDGPTKVFDALAEACFEDEAAKFKDAAAAAIKRHRTWT